MRIVYPAVLSLAFLAVVAWADVPPHDVHQASAPPPDARFEIVQSQLAARWTFRLDRYAGRVWRLVTSEEYDSEWQAMEVVQPPAASGSRPRFQLFASGLASRFLFLIDTDTGRTWQLSPAVRRLPDGSDEELLRWEPLPD
jgi:hypothetical protein